MNKFQVLNLMRTNGDSVLTLLGDSDIVATTDFSNKYIKKKKFGKFTIQKDCILLYSWTDDKFRNIEFKKIKVIKPLSSILGNIRDGEERY